MKLQNMYRFFLWYKLYLCIFLLGCIFFLNKFTKYEITKYV